MQTYTGGECITKTNTTFLRRAVKKQINWNEIWLHGKYEIISMSQMRRCRNKQDTTFFFFFFYCQIKQCSLATTGNSNFLRLGCAADSVGVFICSFRTGFCLFYLIRFGSLWQQWFPWGILQSRNGIYHPVSQAFFCFFQTEGSVDSRGWRPSSKSRLGGGPSS